MKKITYIAPFAAVEMVCADLDIITSSATEPWKGDIEWDLNEEIFKK